MNGAQFMKEIANQKMIDNIEYLEQETKQKINREIDHFISEVVNEVTKNESNVKQLTNIFNNNYEITDKVPKA
ncbi:uncharacterized protein LOC108733598 isoform X6 [Agrilus planipennis]|uniref:Uncharacterized protein LOC108733598 isoform X6 n=1 Tax=Agrilus planipennis TaxID=224129 RepID=A0A1W4WJP4_AGRPL|nr:uncharacterized protein LOC108733598 isoform X6 [Agrilus planipennis]